MHIPHYDFVTSSRLQETTYIASADVILFDGIMAFYQVRPGNLSWRCRNCEELATEIWNPLAPSISGGPAAKRWALHAVTAASAADDDKDDNDGDGDGNGLGV